MNVSDVLNRLKDLGDPQTLKTFKNHGAPENCYGVKIGLLKTNLLKEVKKNHELCLALFATGNTDAQYLAGLGIDPKKMKKSDIILWLNQSNWTAIDETIVAGVASESLFAVELANEWLNDPEARVQNVGWLTYGKYLSIAPNEEVSKHEIEELLRRIQREIHDAPNLIRHSMNQFIIYVGSYYPELTELALEVASEIKDVEITLPTKGCKLPDPAVKIQKLIDKNRLGVKRKKVIC